MKITVRTIGNMLSIGILGFTKISTAGPKNSGKVKKRID
jgi:hypothetical protein